VHTAVLRLKINTDNYTPEISNKLLFFTGSQISRFIATRNCIGYNFENSKQTNSRNQCYLHLAIGLQHEIVRFFKRLQSDFSFHYTPTALILTSPFTVGLFS
jgi:hypothetical protein